MNMDTKRLDDFMDKLAARGIPLGDLAISLDGKQVYRRYCGHADHAGTRAVDKSTLYWIYSCTKVLTCTAAMRLIEDGRLHLEDEVSMYLPEFRELSVKLSDGSVVPCKTPMKVIHLFTMTGGLDYNAGTEAVLAARRAPHADTVSICSAMARDPLAFEPGTHWLYSHCIDVLGAVVEVASGMKLLEYLNKIMFEPLGMENTGFHPTPEQRSRIAEAYSYDNAHGVSTPISENNGYPLSEAFESGGGGLFSSVDDYMRAIGTLARGGTSPDGYKLLSAESIAQMEVNRLCPDAWRDFVGGGLYGYGWGLCGRVHVDPVRSMSLSSVGEFGWDGMHGAYSHVDRARGVAIFFETAVSGCAYAYTVLHPLLRNLTYEMLF